MDRRLKCQIDSIFHGHIAGRVSYWRRTRKGSGHIAVDGELERILLRKSRQCLFALGLCWSRSGKSSAWTAPNFYLALGLGRIDSAPPQSGVGTDAGPCIFLTLSRSRFSNPVANAAPLIALFWLGWSQQSRGLGPTSSEGLLSSNCHICTNRAPRDEGGGGAGIGGTHA